ncbi:MAG TPA: RsmB/NOP family class I SAM-dependent RNA methyltransferase [Chitinophaga sp.]
MTRWESYMVSTRKVLEDYDGKLPLHYFLKDFFRTHPQMGSRDRRWITQLAYHYFRLGHWQKDSLSVEERLLAGTFLCEQAPNEILAAYHPAWNEQVTLPLAEKMQLLGITAAAIFPFSGYLSEGLDAEAFVRSFLSQPRLFIRVRKNKQDVIEQRLQENAIPFETPAPGCISLPNGTKIAAILPEKSWYVVQDASSQQTGRLFQAGPGQSWWDACAASGGKSILLRDKFPDVQLTVSDIRRTILDNLRQRFADAGIDGYKGYVMDLSNPFSSPDFKPLMFDGIIVDAPCSGAGTWARSPEHLFYFSESQLRKYEMLQRNITTNVAPYLKKGGQLVYITCSVFASENESIVQWLEANTSLRAQEGGLIPGMEIGADTMFAVRLVKEG